jgi:hypothetical protein
LPVLAATLRLYYQQPGDDADSYRYGQSGAGE